MATNATDQSLVEERWPHIAALHRVVMDLAAHQSTHHVGGQDSRALAETVAAELNRAGGPKISSRAIV